MRNKFSICKKYAPLKANNIATLNAFSIFEIVCNTNAFSISEIEKNCVKKNFIAVKFKDILSPLFHLNSKVLPIHIN